MLDLTSSQDDLHRVVADLRPPARAHGDRSAPLALTSPLVDLFPFVPPQCVTERVGRLPVVFRELLPPGSTWIHARTPLAGFVRAGGVVVTLREGHGTDPWEPGLVLDPARGDRVDLVVRGLPTFLALPDARTTVLGCRATFRGRPVTVTVESTAWPEVLLLQLLHASDLG